MKKLFQNRKVINLFKSLGPFFIMVLILTVLRYTGALSGITSLANETLIETGLLNADVNETARKDVFNFNFTIKDLEGNKVDVNQFKGKVLIINLWATWCGPCRAEMPSIQSLYNKVDKTKIAFVMLDWFENQEKTSKFILDKGYTFPVYLTNNGVPKQLNVPSIPTTFVIRPDGKIASKKVGMANYDTEEFKKFLEELATEAQ